MVSRPLLFNFTGTDISLWGWQKGENGYQFNCNKVSPMPGFSEGPKSEAYYKELLDSVLSPQVSSIRSAIEEPTTLICFVTGDPIAVDQVSSAVNKWTDVHELQFLDVIVVDPLAREKYDGKPNHALLESLFVVNYSGMGVKLLSRKHGDSLLPTSPSAQKGNWVMFDAQMSPSIVGDLPKAGPVPRPILAFFPFITNDSMVLSAPESSGAPGNAPFVMERLTVELGELFGSYFRTSIPVWIVPIWVQA